jgi:formylglycine-generating enzyme required for sulfatase activity
VSALRLDEYLVTVGRFRQFVSAWDGGAGWTPTAGSGKHTHLNGGKGLNATGGGFEPGWVVSDDGNITPTSANLVCEPGYSTWTSSASTQENLPMSCANWYEAYAFCIWDGGFLPSEAEWEYAAAGGSQQREYPWGSAAPGTRSAYAIYDFYFPTGSSSEVGVANFAPVGYASLGAGRWGQLDMAGEVFEWGIDYWDGTSGYTEPCTDCANTTAALGRVRRGGCFGDSSTALLPPGRYLGSPTDRTYDIGFRCARTP